VTDASPSSPASFEPPRRNPLLVQLGNVGLSATPETRLVQARRLIPFVLLWTVAILLPLVLPHANAKPGWLAASGVVAFLTGLSILFSPPSFAVREWRVVPVITMCMAVVMLSYGSGAASRGYGQMLLVMPVIWQGVYGRVRDTVISLVVVAFALVIPMVFLPGYPVETELPRAVLVLLVCGVVGGVLQSLMRSLRANDEVLTHLSAMARDLYASDDPRTLLSHNVAELAEAPVALLVERRGPSVVLTASWGIELPERTTRFTDQPSEGRRTAFATGEIVFEPDPGSDHLVAVITEGSRLHVPIGPHDAPTAVVTAIWPRIHHQPPSIVMGALRLVGADAGVALERIDLVAQLADQAHRDGLTGLPNRRAWDAVLDREIARVARSGRPLSLAVLDLDRFKTFNDQHGHLAGDELLCAAAESWRSELRTQDVLARWGGEEFAVLFPDSTVAEAAAVLQRLRPATPDGQSFSAGVCQYVPGERPETLMAAADALMYVAKSRGRDQILTRGDDGSPVESA